MRLKRQLITKKKNSYCCCCCCFFSFRFFFSMLKDCCRTGEDVPSSRGEGDDRDLQHQVFHEKPQTAFCSYSFAFQISNFSKASSSVQFISFLFNQNIIQYKDTYRNCKLARQLRRNQKAYEAWAPQSQRNIVN